MNKLLEKRNSLERFIREQTLGPGINGYRFIDLEDENMVRKDLSSSYPIDYATEILDIVPAAIYSTGILFPKEIKTEGNSSNDKAISNNEIITADTDVEEGDSQDSSLPDIEEKDTLQIDQMFPKAMGFTCCLDESFMTKKFIEIKVQARYYKKLKKDKEGKFRSKYGLLVEVNVEALQKFIQLYELNAFNLVTIERNNFLILQKLSTEEITVLNKRIREIQKQLAELLYDKTKVVFTLQQLSRTTCYLSNLKSSIYYELKNTVTDEAIRDKLYDISQEIELIENITDHLRNLLDSRSGGYGLWQSEIIERVIKIENIDFAKPKRKKTFLYDEKTYSEKITVIQSDKTETVGLKDVFKFEIEGDKNNYASLSANIQLSRDSRKEDTKIFCKVQLVNTSTPFDESKQNDNRYYSTFNELVNQKAFFGVKLSLSSEYLVPYNNYAYNINNGDYDEDTTTRFIYNQFKDYGTGHGCSVSWDAKNKSIETEYIPVCETPDIEPVPRNKNTHPILDDKTSFYKDPFFLINNKFQEFKWLSTFSTAKNEEIIEGLMSFVDSYGNWISIKRNDNKYKSEFKGIAAQELDKCQGDYVRMKRNIENLLVGNQNKQNIESFRLMNAAMFMQIWHSFKVKKDYVKDFVNDPKFSTFNFEFYQLQADDKFFGGSEPVSWRAFQLAFILLNLDGIFQIEDDNIWDERNNLVDLVWFPTGGGKTEAYLGLIALTIIHRRRKYLAPGGGTAAIMRYTLRLLTMQQFQRATLVIMALELIRRWGQYNLGVEPITIGLWVGINSIPNSNKDLIFEYEEKLNLEKENRIPFTSCPWCNSKIKGETKEDIEESTDVFSKNRVHLKCLNQKCSFSFGLGRISKKRTDQGPIPVCLSDETIYQHPPSLLFGTVDKFAQLAHKINGTIGGIKADSRRIFGRGNWEVGKPNEGYLPPDLIIQDELHLLLGPLGSAVALFESAVNQLCTRTDGTRPKIISSTATTRNTQLQIAALFDRKVNLFPKPGVECDDSFFAYYSRQYSNLSKDNQEYLSKRKYFGILPTGRTQIWMQMRMAAIVMTHRAIFELKELGNASPVDFGKYNDDFEKVLDYYHTTISYFNSLKEVGKTQSQVQTYILKELRRVFSRVVRPRKLMHSLYTYGPILESELTGRLSGEEVKNELKKVELKWSAKSRFAHTINNEIIRGKTPPEFVVATNMISVGIDVSRFNTIIMNSMPRNTAEYIQASSRVARDSYGLVLTIHHPFRARDISHYEKFIEFHEKMYSYVEPISITPFTKKAVERYMGLYLATMVRHMIPMFVERDSAKDISILSEDELKEIISELMRYFEERKNRLTTFDKSISNMLKDENINQIRNWIEQAFFEWKVESTKAILDKKFVFNNKAAKSNPPQEQLYVDIEEYEGNIHSKKWQVPMSLRVIEPEAAIKINPQ